MTNPNDSKVEGVEVYTPMYLDTSESVLNVCICDHCDAKIPKLEELAKHFRLNLLCKNQDNEYASIYSLLTPKSNEQ